MKVAHEMLCCARDQNLKEGADMLGRLMVATVTGLVAWKYGDALTEYMKGDAGLVRERVDALRLTVQEKSETLLDRAKKQISSRLENARRRLNVEVNAGKLSTGASWETDRGRPTG
jgi:hypothetical protein